MSNYLALDFDGVVSDSILECMVSAQNAYSAFKGSNKVIQDLSGFSKAEVRRFRSMRNYIRRGEDYVYLRLAEAEHYHPNSQVEFDAYLQKNRDKRETFRTLFYGMRSKLQTEHPSEWLQLSPVYPDVSLLLRQVIHSGSIFIVTTKDLVSVKMILEANHIQIKSDQMFQATKTRRKPEILEEILEDHQLEVNQLSFIDDHPDTVLEVAMNTKVTAYCAVWGYNTAQQRSILDDKNIQTLDVIQLSRFMRELNLID